MEEKKIYPEVHPPPSYSELPPSQQQVSHGRYGQPPPPHNYNVPLPVVQQPCNPTTVVVNQPLLQQTRLWSSGTCDCTDDPGICLFVWFCGPCASWQLALDLDEHPCIPWCVPNWLTAVRTKVRMLLGIQGSICDDYVVAAFCGCCTLCQLMREVKLAKQTGQL